MPAALLPVPDDVQEARSVRADNWTDLAELREHAPQIRETASSAGGSARQDSHGTRLRHASAGRACGDGRRGSVKRSEEHTSELQSLMRSSYAVFCLKKK